MPAIGPISRRDLIKHLKSMGFEGPYAGSKHQVMIRGYLRVWIPNPHSGDIDSSLLTRILRQAGISRSEWERL